MTHQISRILCGLLVLFCGFTACSPSIQVNHRDPTHQSIQVIIDDGRVRMLDYGDDKSISVSEGPHVVTVVPEGKKISPWTEDGKGWTIWVEKEAILTLLPPMGTGANE